MAILFMVKNKITGDYFVGDTVEGFSRARSNLKARLKAGAGPTLLQQDWDKYGGIAEFDFVQLYEGTPRAVRDKKWEAISTLRPALNVRMNPDNPRNDSYRRKPVTQVEYQGQSTTLRKLAEQTGLSAPILRWRWNRGWRGEKLVSKAHDARFKGINPQGLHAESGQATT